jgi:hypothetical protein
MVALVGRGCIARKSGCGEREFDGNVKGAQLKLAATLRFGTAESQDESPGGAIHKGDGKNRRTAKNTTLEKENESVIITGFDDFGSRMVTFSTGRKYEAGGASCGGGDRGDGSCGDGFCGYSGCCGADGGEARDYV